MSLSTQGKHGLQHPKAVIMAGGTGGHIFPGLALAESLKQAGWSIYWLGGAQGLEHRLVPEAGYALQALPIAGVRGKGLLGLLKAPFKVLNAVLEARRWMKRVQPNVVVGFGGYSAFPGGVAAWVLDRPLVVHEQNAVAGLTNRLLAKIATKVVQAFPAAFGRAGETLGNPLRQQMLDLPNPQQRYGQRQGPLQLLVVGGSLGAQALNEMVPQAMALLAPAQRPVVLHQAGAKHLPDLQARYAALKVEAQCVAFIDDMAAAYARADLVICRAGAMTVAELSAVGVASLLVPFPHAVDDHQTANARYLSEEGAAWMWPQTKLSAERLAQMLEVMTRDELQGMAVKARQLGHPQATEALAKLCIKVAAR